MSAISGAAALVDGWRALTSGGMFRFLAAPFAIALVIVSAGIVWLVRTLDRLAERAYTTLPDWAAAADVVVTPLIWILGLLGGGWLVGWLATIVAGPFMGDLSRAIERRAGLPVAPPDASWASAIVAAAGRELRKLGHYLPRLALVALITIVPVLNLVAPAAWFWFGAWTMALQFVDLAAENRGEPFTATRARLRADRGAAFGFGACVAAGMAVPVLNLLVIPVAVAGGTVLYHRLGAHAGAGPVVSPRT